MLSFFPRGVLDEILNLIESVSEDFPSYSNFQILEVKVRSVRSTSLIIYRKWLLHHQKVTRYSRNLKIGMEHKHTVQTQIRLLHLIWVYTISYSAVLNKHKRKYGEYSILNVGPKYLRIHCVSRSYYSI